MVGGIIPELGNLGWTPGVFMPTPVPVPLVPAAWAQNMGGLSLPWQHSDVEVRGHAGLGKAVPEFRSVASS